MHFVLKKTFARRGAQVVVAASLAAALPLSAMSVGVPVASAAEAPGAERLSLPQLGGLEGIPGYKAPVLHPGAPVPTPFPLDYLGGYISDISPYRGGIYYDVVEGFKVLQDTRPDVMQQNLEIVVNTNNAAANNPALIARAQMDADADQVGLLQAMSDALGAEFGQAFRDALTENRLPKTNYLIGNGYLARAGGVASSTWIEKEIFRYERPFVVAPERINKYQTGPRYFYTPSKSFPSGHTNQATWATVLLAMALPEVGPQLVARGAEAGYNRMVMGVHYPLDVIGGRMTGTAAAADRWNDPRMRDAIRQAGDEIRAEMLWRTGKDIATLVAGDTPYRTTQQAVQQYTQHMSHGFSQIGDTAAPMIVPQAAPDLLLPFFPHLNYAQRAEVLRVTALPAGYPLDDQSPRGSWQRLNLAAAMAAKVVVNPDGSVRVN